jgi:hypothetical protein
MPVLLWSGRRIGGLGLRLTRARWVGGVRRMLRRGLRRVGRRLRCRQRGGRGGRQAAVLLLLLLLLLQTGRRGKRRLLVRRRRKRLRRWDSLLLRLLQGHWTLRLERLSQRLSRRLRLHLRLRCLVLRH